MARYQVILAYDGAGFFGSQVQAKFRTVQGELEKALRKLGWVGSSVLMAGRTDTGVNAAGQVAAFDIEWHYSTDTLLKALNANLPPDLVVRDLVQASDAFHPRFDADSRMYYYCLFCDPIRNPLREKNIWRVWPPVDGEMLASIAQIFLGVHDFSAFGSPTRVNGSTVRTVQRSEWSLSADGSWRYEIQANSFLFRMVRRLVYAQVVFAQGKLDLESLQNALHSGQTFIAGLAPAHGLTLGKVTYGSKEKLMKRSDESATENVLSESR